MSYKILEKVAVVFLFLFFFFFLNLFYIYIYIYIFYHHLYYSCALMDSRKISIKFNAAGCILVISL